MRALFSSGISFLLLTQTDRATTVAYYRFDEGTNGMIASGTNTVLDGSGNGLNATPVASPIYSTNVPPNLVQPDDLSLRFNGSSNWVFIPDYPQLALTKSLTLEAFIEAEAYPDSTIDEAQILFRGDDDIALDPYFIELRSTNLFFAVTDYANQMAAVQVPITLHQWHHVAGTLDGATGSLRLYLDGNLVAATNTTVRPYALLRGRNPGLGIGNVQSAHYAEYFNGYIDEVRISDAALAPGQFLNAPIFALQLGLKRGHTLQLDCNLLAGEVQGLTLLQASQISGPWTTNDTAPLTTNGTGSFSFQILGSPSASQFYRVQAR